MERVLVGCAGLDVHKRNGRGLRSSSRREGDRAQHVRTFGRTMAELLTRRDWLEAPGATHVVLESTGMYWRPVFRAVIGATRRGRAFDGRAGSAHGATNACPRVRRPSPTQLSPP